MFEKLHATAYQIRISILEVQLGEISVLVYVSFGRCYRFHIAFKYIRIYSGSILNKLLSLNKIKTRTRPRKKNFFKNVLLNLNDGNFKCCILKCIINRTHHNQVIKLKYGHLTVHRKRDFFFKLPQSLSAAIFITVKQWKIASTTFYRHLNTCICYVSNFHFYSNKQRSVYTYLKSFSLVLPTYSLAAK